MLGINHMGWITVEDNLPDESKEVIFFAVQYDAMRCEIMVGSRIDVIWYNHCAFCASSPLPEDMQVTHWMELPSFPGLGI